MENEVKNQINRLLDLTPSWFQHWGIINSMQLRPQVKKHIKNNNSLQASVSDLLGITIRTLEDYLRRDNPMLLRLDVLNLIYFDLITSKALDPDKYDWFDHAKLVYALIDA